MDIFFAGNHIGNSGPRIVNRNYIRCLQGKVSYTTSKNKLLRFFEVIWKTLCCKVIIFSGLASYDHFVVLTCRLLRKKMLYIMHGYLGFENRINGYRNRRGEKNEALLIKHSDAVLCVSETFMLFVKQQFPQYAHKISCLTNGIDWDSVEQIPQKDIPRDSRHIVLIGGGRTTKKNLEVCKAVALLNQQYNEGFHISVFGSFLNNDQSREIAGMPCATFHPRIPHDKMLETFMGAFLFVQNSVFEPFSLGVVEALLCGCDILISDHIGAKDIIQGMTSNDLISDPSDIEQIAAKIRHLSVEHNNKRLVFSIDKKETSIERSADKLLKIAKCLT